MWGRMLGNCQGWLVAQQSRNRCLEHLLTCRWHQIWLCWYAHIGQLAEELTDVVVPSKFANNVLRKVWHLLGKQEVPA